MPVYKSEAFHILKQTNFLHSTLVFVIHISLYLNSRDYTYLRTYEHTYEHNCTYLLTYLSMEIEKV